MGAPDALRITRRERIAQVIEKLQAAGLTWRLPIYRAAHSGTIALAEVTRTGQVPPRMLRYHERPLLVMLGDDDYASTGPAGWPQVEAVLCWARAVIVHTAGPKEEHYALAAAQTAATGRVVLLETSVAMAPIRCALAARFLLPVAVLLITPLNGGQHPVAGVPAGEVVQ